MGAHLPLPQTLCLELLALWELGLGLLGRGGVLLMWVGYQFLRGRVLVLLGLFRGMVLRRGWQRGFRCRLALWPYVVSTFSLLFFFLGLSDNGSVTMVLLTASNVFIAGRKLG